MPTGYAQPTTSAAGAVPDDMQAWVESEARTAVFADSSTFIRQLLTREKFRQESDKLDSLLRAGLESGPPQLVDDAWFAALEAELLSDESKAG